jgi:hypothetical protein
MATRRRGSCRAVVTNPKRERGGSAELSPIAERQAEADLILTRKPVRAGPDPRHRSLAGASG